MEMYYRSKGINNYLDVMVGSGKEINDNGYAYQIRMIEENDIPYLLRPVKIEADGMLSLRYETNTKYVLDRMLQRSKINGEILISWIAQILGCMEHIEKYLLTPDNLVLLPEYMFCCQPENNVSMIYLPGYEKNIIGQLRALMEYFMQHFDVKDRDGIQVLYGFHAMICGEDVTLPKLLQYVEVNGIPGKYVTGEKDEVYGHQINTKSEDAIILRSEACKLDFEKENQGGHWGRFHITVGQGIVMGINLLAAGYMLFQYGKNGTGQHITLYVGILLVIVFAIQVVFCFGEVEEDADTVMREYRELKKDGLESGVEQNGTYENYEPVEQQVIHRLVPLTNGSLCEINLSDMGETCVVGRGKKETHYRLPTTQISRVHARIYHTQGIYYLEDMNSTNGTYINSVKIPAQQPVKLNTGDIVAFANEEFFVS